MNASSDFRAPSAAARRFHYGLKVVVIALAMTAMAVFGVLLVSRANVRLDVTATRDHRLSPRTTALLGSLDRHYDIVIAAPRRGTDSRAWQRLGDVLEAMTRESDKVGINVIDTGSADGAQQFSTLLQALADRTRPAIDAAVAQVTAAADRSIATGKAILTLTDAMVSAGDAAGPTSPLRQNFIATAGQYSAAANELIKTADAAKTAMGTTDAALPAPATDAAGASLRTASEQVATSLSDLVGGLRTVMSRADTPAALKDRIPTLIEQAGAARDSAARTAVALAGVKHPPVLAVARSIARSAAALVIAEPRETTGATVGEAGGTGGVEDRFITAVPIERLLPPKRPDGAGGPPAPDTRFLAEELLASGVDSLQGRTRPIVVFVHAELASLAPEFRSVRGIVERLALMGIDCTDWSVSRNPEQPPLSDLNPDGSRPVVYVTLSAEANDAQGATRLAKLADAISRLVERGERVFICSLPSPVRAFGAPDPMVSFLEPLGVTVDSGRTLLREFTGPQRRSVTDELLITDPGTDHPAARPTRGLATLFVWPLPITLDTAKGEAAHATLAPLLVVPADQALWAESQWQDFRNVPREQRDMVRNPPAKDSPTDIVGGPWTIAATIERAVDTANAGAPKQRIVVVGSLSWFADTIALATVGMVDGRLAPAAPGNIELFTGCVLWLSGMDDRIASGPVASAVATIPPLDPGTFSLIRWALVAGVPVGVLVLGAAWRMMKG